MFVSVRFRHVLKPFNLLYDHVLLTLQDNTEVHFKIKKTTQLRKLKQAYCDRQVTLCVYVIHSVAGEYNLVLPIVLFSVLWITSEDNILS